MRTYLAVIVSSTAHMLLWLNVTLRAKRTDPRLGHNYISNIIFHGGEGVPVSWDLLVGTELQLAGEGMWMVQCCRKQGTEGILSCSNALPPTEGALLYFITQVISHMVTVYKLSSFHLICFDM